MGSRARLSPAAQDDRPAGRDSYFFTLEDYLGGELDPPVKTRFGEITTPVSVLAGGHGFEGTRLWAERIVSQAPTASLTIIPEADHFPMLSAPQQFAAR